MQYSGQGKTLGMTKIFVVKGKKGGGVTQKVTCRRKNNKFWYRYPAPPEIIKQNTTCAC